MPDDDRPSAQPDPGREDSDPDHDGRGDRVARRGAVLAALLAELGLGDESPGPTGSGDAITEPLETRDRTDPAPGSWCSAPREW